MDTITLTRDDLVRALEYDTDLWQVHGNFFMYDDGSLSDKVKIGKEILGFCAVGKIAWYHGIDPDDLYNSGSDGTISPMLAGIIVLNDEQKMDLTEIGKVLRIANIGDFTAEVKKIPGFGLNAVT